MKDDQNWKTNSKPIEKLNIEIGFILQHDFYTGDPNSHEQLSDPKNREPLSLPSFPRENSKLAFTSEAIGNEEELISYYRQVVERAFLIGRSFNEIRSYFWLRLYVWDKEAGLSVSFPWYDSLTEIQNFTRWLASPTAEAFSAIEQGWQVDAVRDSGFLYLRELDPDGDEEYNNSKVAIGTISMSAFEVEARAIKIVERLSEGLGTDVWSKYLRDTTFGTSSWQPNE